MIMKVLTSMKKETLNNYYLKRKYVQQNQSKLFQKWHDTSDITKQEFLKGLRWLCEDPCCAGRNRNLETRELCLLVNGRIAMLYRQYRKDDSFAGRFDKEGNKVTRQYIEDTLTCHDEI